jgi:hypothetical protein
MQTERFRSNCAPNWENSAIGLANVADQTALLIPENSYRFGPFLFSLWVCAPVSPKGYVARIFIG